MAATTIYLYGKAGCRLCDEAREFLDAILAARAENGLAVPAQLEERDILSNPDWERAHFLTIPVLELEGRRLDLATSPAKIRAFLAEAYEEAPPIVDARLSC